MSSGYGNQFDKMDDYSVELVCDQLFKNKEYLSLYHLTLTDKRLRRICQKYLDRIHQGINVMINHVGERYGELDLIYCIPLMKIKKFFKMYVKDENVNTFRVSVVIPNKSVTHNKSFDFFCGFDEDNDRADGKLYFRERLFDPDNLQTYLEFIGLVRDEYERKMATPDIF